MFEIISTEHKNFIISSILSIFPKVQILVFGSRINGTAKKYSDLDLALKCDEEIKNSKLSTLEEIIDESQIPYKVQILDYSKLTDDFKKIVDKNAIVWNLKK